MIRALTSDNIDSVIDLLGWCRHYQLRGPYHRKPSDRFGIGFYQIPQATQWGNAGPVAWQSWCAASLHMMMAAEGFDLGVEAHLPRTITEVTSSFIGWTGLITYTGKAMQQMLYCTGGPHWRRRYKPAILCSAIACSVEACLSMVPVHYRAQGISDEMGILTNDVVIR